MIRAEAPDERPAEAQLGRCSAAIDREMACGEWSAAVDGCEGDASTHTAFPQLSDDACYVPVRYREPNGVPVPDAVPEGCGYPTDGTAAELEERAGRYEAIAAGNAGDPPVELACALPDGVRRSAARQNARALRATATRLREARAPYPYGAIATFGFGHRVMSDSALVDWRPGSGCRRLDKDEMDRFGVNRVRAARAAAAYHGRVAPLVVFSGGAVHADLVEAFMLAHLATCTFGVDPDAVLLDPCADHTHTNVRNTGSLVIAAGARTAYIVTDSGLQGDYLQDWTSFHLVGGSIDQRALRDWGYLLGSWHQASVGMGAGFWFTPYRFWADADDHALTCVR